MPREVIERRKCLDWEIVFLYRHHYNKMIARAKEHKRIEKEIEEIKQNQ